MNSDVLVLGLGNPGPRYAFTRHNIGFIALDILAQDFGLKFSGSGLGKVIQAETAELTLKDKRLLLVKPLTFMNLSGETLGRLYSQHNHLREKPLIVLHDEADIPLGRIRVKKGGSDAGHNGLKSLRAALGHGEFYRVRLGVGRPSGESQIGLKDYVLKSFEKSEEELLMKVLVQTEKIIEALSRESLVEAQAIASQPTPPAE